MFADVKVLFSSVAADLKSLQTVILAIKETEAKPEVVEQLEDTDVILAWIEIVPERKGYNLQMSATFHYTQEYESWEYDEADADKVTDFILEGISKFV